MPSETKVWNWISFLSLVSCEQLFRSVNLVPRALFPTSKAREKRPGDEVSGLSKNGKEHHIFGPRPNFPEVSPSRVNPCCNLPTALQDPVTFLP